MLRLQPRSRSHGAGGPASGAESSSTGAVDGKHLTLRLPQARAGGQLPLSTGDGCIGSWYVAKRLQARLPWSTCPQEDDPRWRDRFEYNVYEVLWMNVSMNLEPYLQPSGTFWFYQSVTFIFTVNACCLGLFSFQTIALSGLVVLRNYTSAWPCSTRPS